MEEVFVSLVWDDVNCKYGCLSVGLICKFVVSLSTDKSRYKLINLPTIKFTASYSRKKIRFVDVEIIKNGNQLVTDLYLKPTDTDQHLHTSSCYAFNFKKSLPYSQALSLDRICSKNYFFDKRCNDLEMWLRE